MVWHHYTPFLGMIDNSQNPQVAGAQNTSLPGESVSNVSYGDIRRKLAEKMAGEITLSDNPGETLKKWRTNFEIAQSDLAAHLKVSPSVISDYESGRRKSPGIFIVSKIVDALLDMDIKRGGAKIRTYEGVLSGGFTSDAIYEIHEYLSPMSLDELAKLTRAEIICRSNIEGEKALYGYTIIDSIKAILELSSNEFQKLYGWSTERAMIFTKVSTGRSPMVAIRVTNFKPGAVVIHGLRASEVDTIAKKIAEIEQVPLLATTMPIDELILALQSHDTR